MLKDIIEKLYFDKCSVYEYEEKTDSVTHQTVGCENMIFENLPCRLSYNKSSAENNDECGVGTVSQSAELIISTDYDIKAGSKIVVTKQTGQTVSYKTNGVPSYYPSHQQITLELFERWV